MVSRRGVIINNCRRAKQEGLTTLNISMPLIQAVETMKKGTRANPNGSRSVILKIQSEEGISSVFDFGSATPEANRLLDIFSKCKGAMHEEAITDVKEKPDETLTLAYKPHKDEIKEEVGQELTSQPQVKTHPQYRGLSSNLTRDIKVKHKQNLNEDITKKKISIALNSEKIDRIFLEFPEVERLYKKEVPQTLNEKTFWTLFIHSKYVKNSLENETNHFDNDEVKRADQLFGNFDLDLTQKRKMMELVKGNIGMKNMNLLFESKIKTKMPLDSLIDPSIDLVATTYDNPHLAKISLSLAGTGLDSKVSDGLYHRDVEEAKHDLTLRKVLKKKKMNGDKISQTLVDNFNEIPKPMKVASKLNSHSAVVLEARIQNLEASTKKRVLRAHVQEAKASILTDLRPEGQLDEYSNVPLVFEKNIKKKAEVKEISSQYLTALKDYKPQPIEINPTMAREYLKHCSSIYKATNS